VPSSPYLQQLILLELLKNPREGYEVTMEATHHGPFSERSCLFVEVGSTEEEWNDEQNGKIIAHAVLHALQHYSEHHHKEEKPTMAIGIGGPHYCSNFNKLSQRKNYAFSHICPKHHLADLDHDMLEQAIEKNTEKIQSIVLDWKGLGQEKQKILDLAHKTGLKVERTDQLLKE
jgi:D-aminoacyl-tRNA deacylase